MAITINSFPDNYSSLHAPLWFVLSSTNTAQTNFKYVCDVYVSGSLVARLKSFPQPTSSKGIFNVAPVVRNYWASYFKPNIVTPTAFSYTGSNIYTEYELKFGEEYGGTTYLDLTTTTKRAYNYVQDYLYTPTSPMYLTPLEYETQYQGVYLSNRDYLNIYFNKERLQTGFLFLSFLSDEENIPKSHSIDVSVYNGSTTTNYTGANVNFRDFALLDISPRALNNYLGTTAISSTSVYYDVKIKIAGVIKDTARVYLSCTQNDVVTLHFLNAIGGYDTFDFTAVNRQTRNIEKSSFEGIEWEYASNYMTRSNAYGVMYGGSNQFATRQKLTYKLISDWLSYVDYLWIKQLIASPEVYLERGSLFLPVQIETNNWVEKKKYADKTYNLELDISIGNQINSQYR
ncbi:MAG: hypothetical protein FJY17_02040 [Bacteroidetes bacterium]|nr:hypothetical protein [Bacteroidota bacterium]